jgi:4-hydroxybenzoate polyprenyltransferase
MNQTILLWIIGLLAVSFIYTSTRLWLAEHDRQVLQERRVVAAQESSGAGCLALLVVVLVAGLALWVYLGLGS